MSDRHASLYIMSRLVSAALNLLSVVVFTRLATPAVYGDYLIGFAMGFMVFGSGFQWLLHAHFGVYAPERAARLAKALLVCLAGVGGAGLLVLAGLTLAGGVAVAEALAMAMFVAGMVVHVGLIELARARLLVREVTAASLLRGVLMLAAGTLALLLAQSAPLLLAAIGLGQLIAALPIVPALLRHGIERPHRADIADLIGFGWPLVPALAAGAIAINLDRILLGQFADAAQVGRYGAVADLVRQGFVVLGEAIAAAYVSQAKAATGPVRRAALLRAASTLWAIVLLGAVAWLLLGEGLADVILGPGFAADIHAMLGLMVLGTALLALRAYYLGQAIYFAGSAQREVVANLTMLALAGTGLALVPLWGVTGAAASFALAQAGALAVFAWSDRHSRLMPYDMPLAMQMAAWCGATGLVGLVALQLGWWAAALVVALSAAGMAWRWDLFGARAILLQAGAAASRRQ